MLPLLLAALLALLPQAATPVPPNRAALVIQYGDGTVESRCIAFAEPEISAEEMLRRTALPIIFDHSFGMGAAVCKIGDDGCDLSQGEECFCQCLGRDCNYWNFFAGNAEGDGWTYQSVGATGLAVRHGSVIGWRWGQTTGIDAGDAAPPPYLSFADVCTEATAVTATDAPAVQPTPAVTPDAGGGGNLPTVVAFLGFVVVLGAAGALVMRRRR